MAAPKIQNAQLRRLYEQWLGGKSPGNSGDKDAIKRKRCLTIGGKDIACVQDKASFKLTPAVLVAGAVIILLLMR